MSNENIKIMKYLINLPILTFLYFMLNACNSEKNYDRILEDEYSYLQKKELQNDTSTKTKLTNWIVEKINKYDKIDIEKVNLSGGISKFRESDFNMYIFNDTIFITKKSYRTFLDSTGKTNNDFCFNISIVSIYDINNINFSKDNNSLNFYCNTNSVKIETQCGNNISKPKELSKFIATYGIGYNTDSLFTAFYSNEPEIEQRISKAIDNYKALRKDPF